MKRDEMEILVTTHIVEYRDESHCSKPLYETRVSLLSPDGLWKVLKKWPHKYITDAPDYISPYFSFLKNAPKNSQEAEMGNFLAALHAEEKGQDFCREDFYPRQEALEYAQSAARERGLRALSLIPPDVRLPIWVSCDSNIALSRNNTDSYKRLLSWGDAGVIRLFEPKSVVEEIAGNQRSYTSSEIYFFNYDSPCKKIEKEDFMEAFFQKFTHLLKKGNKNSLA